MNEIKEMILEKYNDFWYDIYTIEKDEMKKLKHYIDYVEKNLRTYKLIQHSYDGISYLFINKHLNYLKEAFTSILLKNYNAFSCVMRIIIENNVSFFLIKKYKK